MKRIYLRDVPDHVYAALIEEAKAKRQSLSTYVVGCLSDAVRAARVEEYVATYVAPTGTGISLDVATAAVREVRDAS